jgi:hypothetical protein
MVFFFLGAVIFSLLFTESGRELIPILFAGFGFWLVCLTGCVYFLYETVLRPFFLLAVGLFQ